MALTAAHIAANKFAGLCKNTLNRELIQVFACTKLPIMIMLTHRLLKQQEKLLPVEVFLN